LIDPFPWELHPVDPIFATASLSADDKANILGRTAAKLLNIKSWRGTRSGWGLFLLSRTQRRKSAASRGPRYFAWGRFRDFCPGPAVHRRTQLAGLPGDGSLMPVSA